MESTQKKDYGGIAFLPTLVFLAVYLGSGIFFTVTGMGNMAFKQVPRLFAMVVGMLVCMCMGGKERSIEDRMNTFCKGAANEGVMVMIMIYVLAGAFSGVASGMGAVTSTANLGLSLIPSRFVLAGIFLIAAFVSTAMGTCMGTLAAVGPIALAMAEAAGANITLAYASVIGGSMFGDNLSMISDVQIAATRGCGCTLKDKFKLNSKISLIAGAITIIILCTIGTSSAPSEHLEYSVIKVVPYLFVLIVALTGCNTFILLLAGIGLAGVIGLATNSFTFAEMAQSATSGIMDMMELIAAALLLKGISAVVEDLGGIKWLVAKMASRVKTRRGAECMMAAMVSVFDMAVANNTIAVMLSAPLCRSLAAKHNVAPARVATILSIFTCIFQGSIPHGAQILLALQFTGASPFTVICCDFYLIVLAVVTLVFIWFKIGWTKEEKEGIPMYDENLEVIEHKA